MIDNNFNNLVIIFVPQRDIAQSEGDITDCSGGSDILGRAFPAKEYPGRLRGVGYGISQKDIFGKPKHAKHDELEEWKSMVAQLVTQVNELQSWKQEKEKEMMDVEKDHPHSAKDSCTLKSHEVIINFI